MKRMDKSFKGIEAVLHALDDSEALGPGRLEYYLRKLQGLRRALARQDPVRSRTIISEVLFEIVRDFHEDA